MILKNDDPKHPYNKMLRLCYRCSQQVVAAMKNACVPAFLGPDTTMVEDVCFATCDGCVFWMELMMIQGNHPDKLVTWTRGRGAITLFGMCRCDHMPRCPLSFFIRGHMNF